MNFIFFDTETDGLPKQRNAQLSDSDNWPHVVQIGYVVVNDGVEVFAHEDIIKPVGFVIPKEASDIHGVTQEMAENVGRNLSEVMDEFFGWVAKADVVAGHNVSFDLNVMAAEYWRKFQSNPFTGKRFVCTMKTTTNFCAIPSDWGFKWPKLAELYMKLFNEDMGAAHTALQDIRNTVKCYNKLVEIGILKPLT